MNTTQIKCFLAVAETLNFTKAANQLFISQPGLSRQITSLEQELNTLLFLRDNHNVRLTPAAAVLVKELENFETRLEDIIHKVQRVGHGYSGSLTIGTLCGQYLDDELTDMFMKFMKSNPSIDMTFKQGSFRELREWVTGGDIDIAVTLSFDVANMQGIAIKEYRKDAPVFAISRYTENGRKENLTLDDLKDETLILISPEDSRAGFELMRAFLKKNSVQFQNIRYAPNLATMLMWVEAGQGVAVINHASNITAKSSIRLMDDIIIDSSKNDFSCFVWKTDNYNPAIALFTNS